ncbi:hypothetical protein [Sphingomonas sp.]|uniref:hypothetical protein n=1 Tax=Sphingomonas sp. TaxID=28214 RepID=UPI0025D7CF86|nr:hypothetical protein [Sphingomonas sp.]
MSDSETLSARRALNVSSFVRLKELVRELEDNEKRVGADLGSAEIEFKLNPGEMAWYVAYKTAAASIGVDVIANALSMMKK